jgi:hypothetical protein
VELGAIQLITLIQTQNHPSLLPGSPLSHSRTLRAISLAILLDSGCDPGHHIFSLLWQVLPLLLAAFVAS